MPTTRAPAAAARWSGPVSLETIRSDSRLSAASWGRRVRPQRSSSRERRYGGAGRRRAADPRRHRRRSGPPPNFDRAPADLGEVLRRPALGRPPWTQVQDDPRPRSAARTSAAHQRSASAIGRWKRGSETSAPNSRRPGGRGRPRAGQAGAHPRGGCRTIVRPRGHRPCRRGPWPRSPRPSADRSRPCRSIVRSNRPRPSLPRSRAIPTIPSGPSPPASVVDDQLVESRCPSSNSANERFTTQEDGAEGHRSAGQRGSAWRGRRPPCELGLMMQTRCGSIVSRHRRPSHGRGLPSPRSSRGHNLNQVAHRATSSSTRPTREPRSIDVILLLRRGLCSAARGDRTRGGGLPSRPGGGVGARAVPTRAGRLPLRAGAGAATARYSVSRLRFPSPIKTPEPENNVVHAEYFRPNGPGRSGRR